ncbi:MAG TPA: cytochrome c [Sorangium sp.]|nr:cytochrome c [Sorangium sp.]
MSRQSLLPSLARALLTALALSACSTDAGHQPAPSASAAAASPSANGSAQVAAPAVGTAVSTHARAAHGEPPGDAARGRKLAQQFECNRCHGGLDIPPIASESHCIRCHQDVIKGRFSHKADNAKWQKNVAYLTAVPSLAAAGQRLNYSWLVGYLLNPHDLRPNLAQTMPRLPLDRQQARDIASYLSQPAGAPAATDLTGADLARGKKLITAKACLSCHNFGGSGLPPNASNKGDAETRAAIMLAPDLRYARQRLKPQNIVQWLLDPRQLKPDTPMPQTPMSRDEARDIAHFILHAPLTALKRAPAPQPLPVLTRKIGFDEVANKVLNKTCRHCHGDPAVAIGDGGPGNTGGFGFKGRGLNLTSYQRIHAGYLDDAGERHSIFKPMKDGTPRLVAAMLARHREIAGKPDSDIRGMPLGLPAVPMADIQLVASWIAQGRPR